MLLTSSYDLISAYLAIEMQSLSFYALAAFKRKSAFSTEAGLKYFILGAFSSGLILFGSSLIYGFTGVTNLGYLFCLMNDQDIKMKPDKAYEMVIGVAAGEIDLPKLTVMLKKVIK